MITLIEDDYIQHQNVFSAQWIAELNDGTTAYQDDGHPERDNIPSWLRLKLYLLQNRLNIVSLKIRYRSNIADTLPKNAEGYFFSNLAFSIFGSHSGSCYVIGYKDGDIIKTEEWLVPNLTLLKQDERPVIINDFLILNHGRQI
jgi:hypothetical protein